MTLMHNAGAGRIVHPGLCWRGSVGIIRRPRPRAHFCPEGRPLLHLILLGRAVNDLNAQRRGAENTSFRPVLARFRRGSGGVTRRADSSANFWLQVRMNGPIGVLPWLSVMLDLAAFARLGVRKTGVLSGKRSCARVAERQTRWLQVPVSERAWGFKSPLAHANGRTPVLGPGFFCFKRIYEDFPAARSNPPGMTGDYATGRGKRRGARA